jgi:hypothetical protein
MIQKMDEQKKNKKENMNHQNAGCLMQGCINNASWRPDDILLSLLVPQSQEVCVEFVSITDGRMSETGELYLWSVSSSIILSPNRQRDHWGQ